MEFSAMTLNMFVPSDDSRDDDQRIIRFATEQSIEIAELGFNPWYTDHHFRGAWHSNPLQFAAYIVPQIPADRFIGFGVLSAPFYHPLRQLAQEVPGVEILALDASDEDAPSKAFDVLQPDVLVLCAGAFPPTSPLPQQNWTEFAVNWEAESANSSAPASRKSAAIHPPTRRRSA